MKVIIVSDKHGQSSSISLGRWTRTIVSLCLLGIPLGVGSLIGHSVATSEEVLDQQALLAIKERNNKEQLALAETKRKVEQHLQALTLRMAEMQARIVRLDALGQRITSVAKLDKGEFDFSQLPAVGGPQGADLGKVYQSPDFVDAIDNLVQRIDDREQQLEILETLMANRKIEDEVFLAGRPIKKGWMSSNFGLRADPFTGRKAMHEGVDFAGKLGSEIVAVGSGVVTWSGDRYGYGRLVEIVHGNGFMTRYAHNMENKVEVGDIVKKGQTISLMGSSGRSTGPHVHFEVYKHGRPVDPATYIHRASR
ncbi:MAG: M23 family metallopeptidase [Oceanicoccus sp.]|uniref:M23 family metallopeptidase n=1 Tax=Oceanicoccus sp. TaxID=2691044 RepID=UPI002615E795|nr:M23 family metallopeptidase [Oceanicoccus sp.]MCP3906665.1 M23 family metallopeptidase [Oceanicoccus sp.]MDG1773190.1 M23 family metallopeptidase [Oceanicoccus sp.]